MRALCALRGPFLDSRRTFFVCFFRHRARLPRRHPVRACTAACSRTRAAGVVAEVCETGKPWVPMRQLLNMKRSSEGGVRCGKNLDGRYDM